MVRPDQLSLVPVALAFIGIRSHRGERDTISSYQNHRGVAFHFACVADVPAD